VEGGWADAMAGEQWRYLLSQHRVFVYVSYAREQDTCCGQMLVEITMPCEFEDVWKPSRSGIANINLQDVAVHTTYGVIPSEGQLHISLSMARVDIVLQQI